jgi:hypothetical protein
MKAKRQAKRPIKIHYGKESQAVLRLSIAAKK